MELDLGVHGYKSISFSLSIQDCLEILKSLKQLHREIGSNAFEIYSEKIAKAVNQNGFVKACNLFQELYESNEEIKKLEEKEKIIEESSSSELKIGDLISFADEFEKKINFEGDLIGICTALFIYEIYKQKIKSIFNESIQEENSWTPPINFAYGTDKEKEIWNQFKNKNE
jgi:hypothetical protein